MLVLELWIDYFRERDTTRLADKLLRSKLWIDYFRERDTTILCRREVRHSCGLITLGNEIQQMQVVSRYLTVVD